MHESGRDATHGRILPSCFIVIHFSWSIIISRMVGNCNRDISSVQIWRIIQEPGQKGRSRLQLNSIQVSELLRPTRPGVNLHSCPSILVWSHLHRCWAGISGGRLIKPSWKIFAVDAQILSPTWMKARRRDQTRSAEIASQRLGGEGCRGAHKAAVICGAHVLPGWAEALNYRRYTTACPSHPTKVWSFCWGEYQCFRTERSYWWMTP